MSLIAFAEHIGVSERIVSKWLRVYARFVHDSDEDANRRISEWLRQWG